MRLYEREPGARSNQQVAKVQKFRVDTAASGGKGEYALDQVLVFSILLTFLNHLYSQTTTVLSAGAPFGEEGS